jgi:hypothetical protein
VGEQVLRNSSIGSSHNIFLGSHRYTVIFKEKAGCAGTRLESQLLERWKEEDRQFEANLAK